MFTYITPDKALDIPNGLLGKHWLEHFSGLLRNIVLEGHERSRADARGAVQAWIFLPSLAHVIDFMESSGFPKVKLC